MSRALHPDVFRQHPQSIFLVYCWNRRENCNLNWFVWQISWCKRSDEKWSQHCLKQESVTDQHTHCVSPRCWLALLGYSITVSSQSQSVGISKFRKDKFLKSLRISQSFATWNAGSFVFLWNGESGKKTLLENNVYVQVRQNTQKTQMGKTCP